MIIRVIHILPLLLLKFRNKAYPFPHFSSQVPHQLGQTWQKRFFFLLNKPTSFVKISELARNSFFVASFFRVPCYCCVIVVVINRKIDLVLIIHLGKGILYCSAVIYMRHCHILNFLFTNAKFFVCVQARHAKCSYCNSRGDDEDEAWKQWQEIKHSSQTFSL